MREVWINCVEGSHVWSYVDRETADAVLVRAQAVMPLPSGSFVLRCAVCPRYSIRVNADRDTAAAALRPVLLVF